VIAASFLHLALVLQGQKQCSPSCWSERFLYHACTYPLLYDAHCVWVCDRGQDIKTVRATGPKMLQDAMEAYEKEGTGPAVVFAKPDEFFPTFDDMNNELAKCCVADHFSACGVDAANGKPEVEGRRETCDLLQVRMNAAV